MSDVVGRVAALNRYPVKSMAGERLEAAELRWRGLQGDRQYAFLRAGNRSRFPWFTGRDQSDMVRYRARYRDPDDTRNSPVEVTAPEGATFALDDDALRARFGGDAVELVQLGRGAFDTLPVSVVTTASLAAVDAAYGDALDPQRFRINIVVDSGLREDAWAERLLAFGDDPHCPRLLLHDRIERCVMITIDPTTGIRSPALMKTVVQRFGNMVGQHASAARQGVIRLGDAVRLV